MCQSTYRRFLGLGELHGEVFHLQDVDDVVELDEVAVLAFCAGGGVRVVGGAIDAMCGRGWLTAGLRRRQRAG